MGKTQSTINNIEVQHTETYDTEILLSLIMLGSDAVKHEDRSG